MSDKPLKDPAWDAVSADVRVVEIECQPCRENRPRVELANAQLHIRIRSLVFDDNPYSVDANATGVLVSKDGVDQGPRMGWDFVAEHIVRSWMQYQEHGC